MAAREPQPSILQRFLQDEAAGGIVLIAAAALAMIAANSPFAEAYFHLLHAETGPVLSPKLGPMTVHLWINDALMAVFFLLVGLEIKRELVGGELASAEKRRLPVIAAVAGMAVPALLYLAVTGGATEVRSGWAIPAATDIAFAIGVLALAGPRVPASLKLFLTTVAIVDDMGAVAIIALFYTHGLALAALGGAAAVAVAMATLNRFGVKMLWPYLIGFAALWYLVLLSGVHATIAGVIAAMTIPGGADESSPLHRLEHALSPCVAFAIVPLFGFANAGVSLAGMSLATLTQPLVLGIALALFFGKQIGIFAAVRLAAASRIAQPPEGASWRQVYGVALLCGIGFTMSLFIGGLAFPGNEAMIDQVKIGVLLGSLASALTGFVVLKTSP
ncbi:Na+/H+ antiporter NhaA [Sphingomonas panacisoli]|uniref:Na(+)/H(+) antiporter NhaA n=1 Tax=Sphingomonas panacisoli TaxID=1813879 RepID=A0A5B8LJZ4_9SPHN|nr:Na+/H+ antiporter NhaA [Sphingomonas panacisoli]QDZ08523.1 Na+/H+ antiporter NhaA [Sphingomonas panacisoli]